MSFRRNAFDPAVASVEPLEPRALLTAYAPQSAADIYGLDRLLRDVAAPAGASAQFGYEIAGLGDIDGDQAPDFAISAPGARDTQGAWTGSPGQVFLFSGRSLSLLRTLSDGFAGFGSALLSVGDLNHDGVSDLAVGSPSFSSDIGGATPDLGRVTLFSGATGAILRTHTGAAANDQLGWALSRAGDLNADGSPDLLVGAPGANRALVYSGADGQTLRTFSGEFPGDRFGESVGGGVDTPISTDLNSDDDIPDYIIGAPGNDAAGADAGRAYVFDGATGALRFTFTGEHAGDRFGTAVQIIGFGQAQSGFLLRYLVGAPGVDVPDRGNDTGRLYRFDASGFLSSNDPSPIGAEGGGRFGSRISLVPDLFNDIQPSYVVFAPGATTSPKAILYPGNPTNGGGFGGVRTSEFSALANVGDLDGDGIADLIGGQPDASSNSGAARIVPLAMAVYLPRLSAISDNGLYAIIGPYVSQNGTLSAISALPGIFPGDTLLAVNNSGLFVGLDAAGVAAGIPAVNQHFFYQQAPLHSQRVAFAQAIQSTVGEPASYLRLQSLSNSGDAVFTGYDATGSIPSAVLFRSGVLRHLWFGYPTSLNDTGVIVGIGSLDAGHTPSILRTTGNGSVTVVPGLVEAAGFYSPAQPVVDSHGRIIATGPQTSLARYDPATGITTTLSPMPPSSENPIAWNTRAVAADGRIISEFSSLGPVFGRPPSSADVTAYFYTPGIGLERLSDIAPGLNAYQFSAFNTKFLADGSIAYGGEILISSDPTVDTSARADSPVATASIGSTIYTAGINTAGGPYLLRTSGAATDRQLLSLASVPTNGGPVATADDVVLYRDARDNKVYAIVRSGSWLVWYTPRQDGMLDGGTLLPIAPAGIPAFNQPMSAFTGPDGVTYITGLAAPHDVVLLRQTNTQPSSSVANWAFQNLSATALPPVGINSPVLAGRLTAFVTKWNAISIFGLDQHGHVQAVWSVAGSNTWAMDDLTDRAAAPSISGSITAFSTSWNAMNVIGTDEAGKPVAIWWVPSFGQRWQYNVLLNSADAPPLESSTIAAYVTPWNAISIIGRNRDTHLPQSYWWAPATNRWQAEVIRQEAAPTPPQVPGFPGWSNPLTISTSPVRAFMTGQSQNLVVVDDLGRFTYRYTWSPGDAQFWTIRYIA